MLRHPLAGGAHQQTKAGLLWDLVERRIHCAIPLQIKIHGGKYYDSTAQHAGNEL